MRHTRDWTGAAASMPADLVHLPGSKLFTPRGELIKRNPRTYTKDGFITFDQATVDAAGAFLVGELERLDPMVHEPLVSVTYPRDIDMRTDMTIGDEFSSFTQSTFGAVGSPDSGIGISWAQANVTSIGRATLDIAKVTSPFDLWSLEVEYTVPELESSRRTGRPIDSQQLTALNLKHQMDMDTLVYVGDPLKATTGLLNNATVSNTKIVANGTTTPNTAPWVTKQPSDILYDINELIVSVWKATGYSTPPTKILIAPVQFGQIATQIVSTAGNRTILDYVQENNVLTAEKGINLDIKSVKWLDQASYPGGTGFNWMCAYTRLEKFVRFPMVPLIPMAPQYVGIWIKVPYYGRLGVVEVVYPETIGYRWGI